MFCRGCAPWCRHLPVPAAVSPRPAKGSPSSRRARTVARRFQKLLGRRLRGLHATCRGQNARARTLQSRLHSEAGQLAPGVPSCEPLRKCRPVGQPEDRRPPQCLTPSVAAPSGPGVRYLLCGVPCGRALPTLRSRAQDGEEFVKHRAARTPPSASLCDAIIFPSAPCSPGVRPLPCQSRSVPPFRESQAPPILIRFRPCPAPHVVGTLGLTPATAAYSGERLSREYQLPCFLPTTKKRKDWSRHQYPHPTSHPPLAHSPRLRTRLPQ